MNQSKNPNATKIATLIKGELFFALGPSLIIALGSVALPRAIDYFASLDGQDWNTVDSLKAWAIENTESLKLAAEVYYGVLGLAVIFSVLAWAWYSQAKPVEEGKLLRKKMSNQNIRLWRDTIYRRKKSIHSRKIILMRT